MEKPKKYILSKTTGYGAILRAFPNIYEIGFEEKTLNYDFFVQCFQTFKKHLEKEGKELTSVYFPSNENEQKKLADLIIKSLT